MPSAAQQHVLRLPHIAKKLRRSGLTERAFLKLPLARRAVLLERRCRALRARLLWAQRKVSKLEYGALVVIRLRALRDEPPPDKLWANRRFVRKLPERLDAEWAPAYRQRLKAKLRVNKRLARRLRRLARRLGKLPVM